MYCTKYKQFILLSLTAIGCVDSPALECLQINTAPRLIACSDGDTCTVEVVPGWQTRVRLAGIDAPELRGKQGPQPFAREGRDFLRQYIDKPVQIRTHGKDRYQRTLVTLNIDGESLGRLMIQKGLAEAYRGPGVPKEINQSLYFADEEQAKRDAKGIWSLSNYVKPYLYRRASRRG